MFLFFFFFSLFVLQYLILAVIFCQVLCLLADGEFDENVADLQDGFDESQTLARPRHFRMEEYQRHPWWIRPRSRRKKNKKVNRSGLPKRMQSHQHRRRMQSSSDDFHPVDDKNELGQMADFDSISQSRRYEDETALDPRRIRIRIRLRQRGPVKRHARQGKKRSKKFAMKLAQKLATKEAMALILKDFLRNNNKVSSKKAARKASNGFRRMGQFALHGKRRRGMKLRAKKRKN
jgi:hypothetical protein